MISVLYVDDEPGLLEIGRIFLERGGQFSVDIVTSAPAALTLLTTKNYDAIVSDYQMPGMDGIEFLKNVRNSGNTIPFILFTGRGREEIVIQAINSGADFYLQKGGEPVAQFAELTHKIKIAVERKRADNALKQNEYRLKTLVSFYQMTSGPLKDMMIFAVEQAVEITASSIGYLAFVSDDESLLTMYAWSSLAMKECYICEKPIEYPLNTTGLWGEAVRQRRPIITNDYAAENPLKKGYPKGHVPIIRHMNIPVFDGTRIVMVAGVGNKTSDYDDVDVHELSVLMNGLWNVIKERRAEEELVKRNEELRVAYVQIAASEEELRSQYEQLAQSERQIRESEGKYRTLVENVIDIIYRADSEGTIIFVTPSILPLIGYDNIDEIIGHPITSFWADPEKRDDLIARMKEKGFVKDYEVIILKRDGTGIPVSISSHFYYDDTGRIVGVEGIIHDITDRKKAEEELRKSEERYRNVVEDQSEFISRFLPDGTHVFVNEAYCRYFGLKREEILGHRFGRKIPTDDQERLKQFFASLTPDHPVDNIEHRIIMPDGNIRWQRWSDRAIFAPSGTIAEYQSVGQDITERKLADNQIRSAFEQLTASEEELKRQYDALTESERALRLSENRLLMAQDIGHIGYWEYSFETGKIWGSAESLHIYGFPSVSGSYPIADIEACVEDRERVQQAFADFITGRKEYDIKITVNPHDGSSQRVVHSIARLEKDAKGNPFRVVGVIQDITERKQMEIAARESEEKYRSSIDAFPDVISVVDREFKVILANTSLLTWLRRLGQSDDIIGKPILEAFPFLSPSVLDEYRTVFLKGTIMVTEESSPVGDAEIVTETRKIPIKAHGDVVAVIAVIRDITEHKQGEEFTQKTPHQLSTLPSKR